MRGSVTPSVSAPMATASSSSNPDTYGSIESEKYDALGKEHAVQLRELQAKNQTLTKQVKDLQESNSTVTELKADNERFAVKVTALNCAKEAHGAKIQDLEKHVTNLNNKYNTAANLLKEKDAALKAALAPQILRSTKKVMHLPKLYSGLRLCKTK
ncbi:hypothetical protein R1sor_019837 [Riccia sorocarpa]|uniref:Uncharacterized protein n=1 Tax=Riccia sorocarpa TaxID=122646 RepID=A0ABD3IHB0_9MARC